jgi:hypothetical protein
VKRRIDEVRRTTVEGTDGGSGDDANPRVAAFLRGVTIGALVGAAIAGSALWERAARRRDEATRRAEADEDLSGT